MRARVAALATLPALVAGVWLVDPTEPAEPADPQPDVALATHNENTVKRRIQYVSRSKAGLHDRLQIFTFLNNLAHYYSATAHIIGGEHSASFWLDHKHSKDIAKEWSFYFDTKSNGGNPFHEANESMPCKAITYRETDWAHIFDDGSQCVNVAVDYYRYNRSRTGKFLDDLYAPKPSANVKYVVQQALRNVTGPYGVLHARRCDRLFRNGKCTDPDHIKELLAATNVTTWLVFTYAEVGYLPALQKKLQELHSWQFIYEDEAFADMKPRGDNYLMYASLLLLESLADRLFELRKCPMSSLTTSSIVQNFLADPEDPEDPYANRDALEAALYKKGVCDRTRANGPFTPPAQAAKLMPPHGYEWH